MGDLHVGGFIGSWQGTGSVNRCYSEGEVSGTNQVGGFLGRDISSATDPFSDNFWDVQTSGLTDGIGSGAEPGVTGKTTVEMKQESTFTNWNFNETWWIDEGIDYPRLTWQLGELPSAVENWRLYNQ